MVQSALQVGSCDTALGKHVDTLLKRLIGQARLSELFSRRRHGLREDVRGEAARLRPAFRSVRVVELRW